MSCAMELRIFDKYLVEIKHYGGFKDKWNLVDFMHYWLSLLRT
jgi:hypothetical protein